MTVRADVPPVKPDFTGPGVSLLQTLGGIAVALGLVVAVIAVVLGALWLVVGGLSRNPDLLKRGLVTVIIAIPAAALMVGANAVVNWGSAHPIGF